MKKLTKILLAASLLAMASIASAVPITGSIGFDGAYTHNGNDLSDATQIFITDASVAGVVTGSFAAEGIVDGAAVTYSDFVFNPTGPIAGLWSVGSFTFDLTSMSVDFQSANSLVLSGFGWISSTDVTLETTLGGWIFTANEFGQNLTWSSSAAVPEPGVVLLLGAGLIGIGATRKMRKQLN